MQEITARADSATLSLSEGVRLRSFGFRPGSLSGPIRTRDGELRQGEDFRSSQSGLMPSYHISAISQFLLEDISLFMICAGTKFLSLFSRCNR